MASKTITSNDLPWQGNQATITLKRGQSAWDPSSTSRVIYGPATVVYIRYPDGGISATVTRK